VLPGTGVPVASRALRPSRAGAAQNQSAPTLAHVDRARIRQPFAATSSRTALGQSAQTRLQLNEGLEFEVSYRLGLPPVESLHCHIEALSQIRLDRGHALPHLLVPRDRVPEHPQERVYGFDGLRNSPHADERVGRRLTGVLIRRVRCVLQNHLANRAIIILLAAQEGQGLAPESAQHIRNEFRGISVPRFTSLLAKSCAESEADHVGGDIEWLKERLKVEGSGINRSIEADRPQNMPHGDHDEQIPATHESVKIRDKLFSDRCELLVFHLELT